MPISPAWQLIHLAFLSSFPFHFIQNQNKDLLNIYYVSRVPSLIEFCTWAEWYRNKQAPQSIGNITTEVNTRCRGGREQVVEVAVSTRRAERRGENLLWVCAICCLERRRQEKKLLPSSDSLLNVWKVIIPYKLF
jgi:hypothetical protein